MQIIPATILNDGLSLEQSQNLWKQYCEVHKKQGRETLRGQVKADVKKTQRNKVSISTFTERHFAPLLYAKILLWELHANTCPQPASTSSSSATAEKECKEQLKALLPTLHSCVVFPADDLSRISLHAAWLHTFITLQLFQDKKDKKMSAEHAEHVQEIRSKLQGVYSALRSEHTLEEALFVKPVKEMMDPNPSPDDKTFEGLVAYSKSDDKQIVEQLLRMAVQASILPSKSRKEGKEGGSKVAEVADVGRNVEGSPAEERPLGSTGSSKDKDSQSQAGKSKGGKSKQQGALKQQGGEGGGKAKGDSELKKRIMESEAKLQQYIDGCKVKACPEVRWAACEQPAGAMCLQDSADTSMAHNNLAVQAGIHAGFKGPQPRIMLVCSRCAQGQCTSCIVCFSVLYHTNEPMIREGLYALPDML
ncbi:hypothetical protein DUNSADRAFT_2244 [Dunaliella salina]|uniref:Uncharacterized protein n=1 Tax=Dunaliella salina TaxID=3046 RepID=A0ABQ7GVZ6_DUNSA|nr:hypothetical protein DUNSADRAFT_2244 [Dunaliella salina]|eukprot:KAF5838781.1 hypothetical protein DUNSADRAFT_2244 [Dunaliella salina]